MLTNKQLSDIKALQLAVEKEEEIQLKLNWDMLHNREEEEVTDFFYYENGQLVGYLALYGFGKKIEICGMVHPLFRRQGIFSKLLKEVKVQLIKSRTKEIYLNAPANSGSAKGFLQGIPCEFAFSEHQMKWSKIDLGDEENIIVRKSTMQDLETEIQLDINCFGFSEEDAKQYNQRIRREATQIFYIVEVNQKNVGKIRVQHMNKEAWIYGFAISPEYQGKGYGKRTLKKIIREQDALGYSIFLEVEAKNKYALKLYESCGFRAVDAQDYYRLYI